MPNLKKSNDLKNKETKSELKIFIKKFIINTIILIAIWFLFYNFLRHLPFVDYIYEEGIFWLTKIQLLLTKIFMSALGYSIEIYGKTVKIVGSYGVHLDRGCLGRNTLGLFVGFILAFPGKFSNKIWFLVIGVVIFILLNVFRIMALAIVDACCVQYLDFNHHITFKCIVWAFILLLWALWINKYSFLSTKKKTNLTK